MSKKEKTTSVERIVINLKPGFHQTGKDGKTYDQIWPDTCVREGNFFRYTKKDRDCELSADAVLSVERFTQDVVEKDEEV